MSIFEMKEYTIIANLNLTKLVRGFVDKHCADGYEADVHVHGSLLEDGKLVTIKFISADKTEDILSDLKNTFGGNHKVRTGRKLIFVLDKEEEPD